MGCVLHKFPKSFLFRWQPLTLFLNFDWLEIRVGQAIRFYQISGNFNIRPDTGYSNYPDTRYPADGAQPYWIYLVQCPNSLTTERVILCIIIWDVHQFIGHCLMPLDPLFVVALLKNWKLKFVWKIRFDVQKFKRVLYWHNSRDLKG